MLIAKRTAEAIGSLRTSGMTQSAIDVEAFFQRCEHLQFSGSSQQSPTDCRKEAREQVERALDSLIW